MREDEKIYDIIAKHFRKGATVCEKLYNNFSMNFNGLSNVHVELSSKCNKECWMCGRRKIDRLYPEKKKDYGFMDFNLLKSIKKQLPDGITVQFHNNGEPLMYPKLKEAIELFKNNITQFNTNGLLLLDKTEDIIGNLDSLCISIIENEPNWKLQYSIVEKFLKLKGNLKPIVTFRFLGDISATFDEKGQEVLDKERCKKWTELANKYNVTIVTRTLHSPDGSTDYEKKVTIPETGICNEILSHMAIDRFGNVSVCVRFDPNGLGIIGNVNNRPLCAIWNSDLRLHWVKMHIEGRRNDVPLCKQCDYWGIPIG